MASDQTRREELWIKFSVFSGDESRPCVADRFCLSLLLDGGPDVEQT